MLFIPHIVILSEAKNLVFLMDFCRGDPPGRTMVFDNSTAAPGYSLALVAQAFQPVRIGHS
jgi:hypothetical protein